MPLVCHISPRLSPPDRGLLPTKIHVRETPVQMDAGRRFSTVTSFGTFPSTLCTNSPSFRFQKIRLGGLVAREEFSWKGRRALSP